MENLKIESRGFTLVDQVEDKLLEFFKNNNICVGDPIPNEQDLAAALNVARSVLREALSRLKMLGLIESRTRRGMILCEPSLLLGLKRVVDPRILCESTLLDILGFRIALEIGICSDIINNVTEEDIKELEEIEKISVIFERNEYAPISEFAFHAKLYKISGNRIIQEFQEIIQPVMCFVKNKYSDLIRPHNKELQQKGLLVTHSDLLDCLRRRDKGAFREAMERHFLVYKLLESNQ